MVKVSIAPKIVPASVYPLQLHRGHPAFTLLQRKFYALAFRQFSQSRALHRADMYENIIATLFRRYEPIALPRIEPFNNTNMRGDCWIDPSIL
jgi:hypothetical protein